MLYPLKFKPIYKDKIWGGQKLKTVLGKNFGKLPNCGESWEISGVEGNVSVVSNGYLKNNSLQELIEVYMGDLVGDSVYEKFGDEFPLLLKYIDASDVLSVQVHPNDELAKNRHGAYGKTEMWYVIQADEGAEITVGLNSKIGKDDYFTLVKNGSFTNVLHTEIAKAGDVFFLPAGRVHAIGSGILLAEIQQTSDITYRIFDWNRTDDEGKPRELHTELAADAIDYNTYDSYKTEYKKQHNSTNKIISCRYFTASQISFNKPLEKDFTGIDSFVIYMCLSGKASLQYGGGESESISMGETILVPAEIKEFSLIPLKEALMLEVYIQ